MSPAKLHIAILEWKSCELCFYWTAWQIAKQRTKQAEHMNVLEWVIPEQFTVKEHPAFFEGRGAKNEALLFQSTVDIHFQNAHKTLFQSAVDIYFQNAHNT